MTPAEIKSMLASIRSAINIETDEGRELCQSLYERSDVLEIVGELSFVLHMVCELGTIPGKVKFIFDDEDEVKNNTQN